MGQIADIIDVQLPPSISIGVPFNIKVSARNNMNLDQILRYTIVDKVKSLPITTSPQFPIAKLISAVHQFSVTLPENRDYAIQIQQEYDDSKVPQFVTLVSNLTAVFTGAFITLTGTVTGGSGTPLAGVDVWEIVGTKSRYIGKTDINGRVKWDIPFTSAGTYSVKASLNDVGTALSSQPVVIVVTDAPLKFPLGVNDYVLARPQTDTDNAVRVVTVCWANIGYTIQYLIDDKLVTSSNVALANGGWGQFKTNINIAALVPTGDHILTMQCVKADGTPFAKLSVPFAMKNGSFAHGQMLAQKVAGIDVWQNGLYITPSRVANEKYMTGFPITNQLVETTIKTDKTTAQNYRLVHKLFEKATGIIVEELTAEGSIPASSAILVPVTFTTMIAKKAYVLLTELRMQNNANYSINDTNYADIILQ